MVNATELGHPLKWSEKWSRHVLEVAGPFLDALMALSHSTWVPNNCYDDVRHLYRATANTTAKRRISVIELQLEVKESRKCKKIK